MGNYLLKGYHIFTDNANALYKLGAFITGTICKNRKFMKVSVFLMQTVTVHFVNQFTGISGLLLVTYLQPLDLQYKSP
jgi:hypothetical protein